MNEKAAIRRGKKIFWHLVIAFVVTIIIFDGVVPAFIGYTWKLEIVAALVFAAIGVAIMTLTKYENQEDDWDRLLGYESFTRENRNH